MMGIKVLWHGFDTAKVGYLVRWPSGFEATLKQFQEYRENAQAAETAQYHFFAKLGNCSQDFIVRPQGARMLPFAFEAMGLIIFIGNTMEPWVHGRICTPNVRVECQPYSVAFHGLEFVHKKVSEIIHGMGGVIEGNMVSELHMTCDVETDRAHTPSDYHGALDRLWSKVRTRIRSNGQYHEVPSADMDMHTKGQRLKLVNIGKDKKMLRIYDKLLELETHRDKIWEAMLWNAPQFFQYIGEYRAKESPTGVMRVEFQLRRERLIELQLSTVQDVLQQQASLWQHLTHEAVVIIENDDANRSRCTTQQWWTVVQGAWQNGPAEKLQKRIKGLPSIEKYVDQAMGLCLALGARLDETQELKFGQIADVLETAWDAKHDETWQARLAAKRKALEVLYADLDNANPVTGAS